ncbi:MAG: RNA methyltransferase [Saprospiraceae bacterium]|nr:RNA methyltransferase [Saprospiraceae bacterium]
MKKLSMSELQRLEPEAFLKSEKFPFVLVLDNIRSALNVGSVFRTADAFAAEGLVLCGFTATPPHKEILKTSVGASSTVSWIHFQESAEAIQFLKENGYSIVCLEQTDHSVPLQSFIPETNTKYAFVLGNEIEGVGDLFLKNADLLIEIPQFGTKHSINVAVCAGIIGWYFISKRDFMH